VAPTSGGTHNSHPVNGKDLNKDLTIQLLPRFDFGHRTSKPDFFDHPTLKTIQNLPSDGFDGWL
jgi:hypothetical protein